MLFFYFVLFNYSFTELVEWPYQLIFFPSAIILEKLLELLFAGIFSVGSTTGGNGIISLKSNVRKTFHIVNTLRR